MFFKRSLSIGVGLASLKLAFLGFAVILGAGDYLGGLHLRELLAAAYTAEPSQAQAFIGMARDAAADLALRLAFVAALAAAAIIAVLTPALRYGLFQPIKSVAKSMAALAAGDVEIEVPATDRDDEIGEMARALLALRQTARANVALAAEIRTRDAREADLRRDAAIKHRVAEIAKDFAAATSSLDELAHRLERSSEAVVEGERRARTETQATRAAAALMEKDVTVAAAASGEMLAAIKEISRQAAESATVARAAVAESASSDGEMQRLAAATSRVGGVVSLISRIAAQTNLLALNATIEAARAGEAGRGFAVVAQEVKTLATQTGKAMQDIADLIAEIQAATDQSAVAMDRVKAKIAEVERISRTISNATEAQDGATQDVSRSVCAAAGGATAISTHMAQVVETVAQTHAGAEAVLAMARELDETARGLRGHAENFARRLAE